ncbi:MAG: hypothetical protein HQM10_02380 [Candidatus Riflebacteria bacterium]|nr:hypothetical protein [Candidatus Riflebacteria bacterium]
MKEIIKILSVIVFSLHAGFCFAEPISIFFCGSLQGVLRNENGYILPRMAAVASETQAKSSDTLRLCVGNMLGPSYSGYFDKGSWVISGLNAIGIDAMIPGPHDFSIGESDCWLRLSEATFPIIWTNLSSQDAGISNLLKSNKIRRCEVFNKGSQKIRIFGIMSPEIMKSWPNWPENVFLEPISESLEKADIETRNADWTIVMGYLSFQEAQTLLQKYPMIDVIITTSNKLKDNLAADMFEHHYSDGRRIIWSRHLTSMAGIISGNRNQNRRCLNVEPVSLDTAESENASLTAELYKIEQKYDQIASNVIAKLSRNEFENYSDAILRGICCELHAELAVIPEAQMNCRPDSQELTESELKRTIPFSERIALLEVPGSIIMDLWNKRGSKLMNGKGLVLCGLQESRGRVLLNGRPIGNAIKYRIAATEYLALGGLSLLPSSPGKVRKETLFDLLSRYFSRNFRDGREKAADRLAHKPYLRHHTSLGFDFNRLDFGGSAPEYQNPQSGGFFMDRDIPGLVGKKYRTLNLDLNWKTVYSKVSEDWIFRGENSLYQRDGEISRDRSKLVLRWMRNTARGKFNPFIEISSLSPLSNSSLSGNRPPLFLEGIIGLKKKISPTLGVLAGVIQMIRQSWPSKPKNTGLQIQYDLEMPLTKRFELSSNMSYFATDDADKIRMYEGSWEIKYRFAEMFSLTLRENIFGWKESAIADFATRQETFFGVTCELGFRRF